jgi:hypothetical protein
MNNKTACCAKCKKYISSVSLCPEKEVALFIQFWLLMASGIAFPASTSTQQ